MLRLPLARPERKTLAGSTDTCLPEQAHNIARPITASAAAVRCTCPPQQPSATNRGGARVFLSCRPRAALSTCHSDSDHKSPG